jgi:hypothetical protein
MYFGVMIMIDDDRWTLEIWYGGECLKDFQELLLKLSQR